MRPQKVIDIDLLNGLMDVLRSKGYSGTTLNDLAASSGLKKASLYHRYPGGKKEIAAAVLQHASAWVKLNLTDVLKNKTIPPKQKLNTVLKNIDQLYNSGENTCILGIMCTSSAIAQFSKALQENMNLWLDGFNALGLESGFTKKQSKSKALKVLVLIQGSLVVANTFKDIQVFQNTLKEIKTMYIIPNRL